MDMGSKIAIGLIGIALLIGGYFVLTSNSNTESVSTVQETANRPAATNGAVEAPKPVGDVPTTKPANPSNYVNYSEAALADASEGGRALLFFHATWCPTCRSAEKDILKNSSDLPADLTILKTDYDTEKALKDKYGVTYQHTFVQVDADGNEITKWGGGGVKTIIQNLEEV